MAFIKERRFTTFLLFFKVFFVSVLPKLAALVGKAFNVAYQIKIIQYYISFVTTSKQYENQFIKKLQNYIFDLHTCFKHPKQQSVICLTIITNNQIQKFSKMNNFEFKQKQKTSAEYSNSPALIFESHEMHSEIQDNKRSQTDHHSQNKSYCKSQSKKQQKKTNYRQIYLWTSVVLSLLVLIMLLFNLYHFVSYIIVSKKIKSGQTVDQSELQNHLFYLTRWSMPFFREQFYEEYIFELGRNKKWQELVERADEALSLVNNKQKFSIYYHKSMALCFRSLFKECKKTIQQAYKFSTKQKLHFIQNIYKILLSNGEVTHDQIPTGAQFALASLIKEKQKSINSQKVMDKNLEEI